jgi:hypothetical protein
MYTYIYTYMKTATLEDRAKRQMIDSHCKALPPPKYVYVYRYIYENSHLRGPCQYTYIDTYMKTATLEDRAKRQMIDSHCKALPPPTYVYVYIYIYENSHLRGPCQAADD